MGNAFESMREAMEEARRVNNAADAYANQMAEMLNGRLKCVSSHHLARLKRQLRDFNIHTGKWKERN